MLGDAGQPVPVPVQAAEERFGKHALQLYCIQCTLVFSLRLERVFHRTEDINYTYAKDEYESLGYL